MPLYPEAARSLDLREYDLVVSSDSGPVKGARIREGTPHLCYCHSPMRYLYDGFEGYRAAMRPAKRWLFTLTANRVRKTDRAAAQRVTQFVANSRYVQRRIQENYGRVSQVIYPPIDLHRARIEPVGDSYLAVGRLVAYKRTEVLVEACTRLNKPLRIVGTGPEEKSLRKAAGPSVTFLGKLSQEQLWEEYSHCRALLFAADEDFGMVPLEAQSCGRPVIAYGAGGSLETVRGTGDKPGRTGIFFSKQTADALSAAILRFEREELSFDPKDAQDHAAHFATPNFLEGMRTAILDMMPAAADSLASVDEAMCTVA